MKRGGFGPRATPLVAHTGLVAKTGLSRATPMSRGAAPGRNGGPETPQQARRKTQLREWGQLRDLVLERDDWTCVRCGRSDRPLDVHHRRHRGQGGSRLLDHPANLISLCGFGNHNAESYCHGFAHSRANTDAAAVGLTVLWGQDALEVAATAWDGVWLYDDEGGRRPYEVAS